MYTDMPCNISGKILCMCSQYHSNYTFLFPNNIYRVFFYWSALKMTKCQTLRKFWHSELFWWDLLCNLTLRDFRGGGRVKKTPCIIWDFSRIILFLGKINYSQLHRFGQSCGSFGKRAKRGDGGGGGSGESIEEERRCGIGTSEVECEDGKIRSVALISQVPRSPTPSCLCSGSPVGAPMVIPT